MCALHNFHLIDGQTTRDQIMSDGLGPIARGQIAFCAFHWGLLLLPAVTTQSFVF